MIVRLATLSDAVEVLKWRNDFQTRVMSWNVNKVEKAAHIKWFDDSVKDQNRIFLIGELGGRKAGMVRFDALVEESNAWKVSIMVSPELRNQGVGTDLLKLAIQYFHSKLPESVLVAEVKKENEASKKLFERHNFELMEFDSKKLVYKLLH